MKTATVRDLRTKFPVLARWIIMKRLREIYGDYVMPEKEAEAILDYNKGKW
jgi:hypothetical protein